MQLEDDWPKCFAQKDMLEAVALLKERWMDKIQQQLQVRQSEFDATFSQQFKFTHFADLLFVIY